MSRPYKDLDDEHLEVMATMFYDMATEAEANAEKLNKLRKEYKEKAQAYDLEITRRKGMGPKGDEEKRPPKEHKPKHEPKAPHEHTPKTDPFEMPKDEEKPKHNPHEIFEEIKKVFEEKLDDLGAPSHKTDKDKDKPGKKDK